MNKKDVFRAGTGASTIMMVFVILCLTTLGVLSFLSSRADARTTKMAADGGQSYYKAQRQLENELSELDALLYSGDDSFKPGDKIELEAPMGDGRYVRAQVEVLAVGDTLPRFEIKEYKTVDMRQWSPDGAKQNIWDGK